MIMTTGFTKLPWPERRTKALSAGAIRRPSTMATAQGDFMHLNRRLAIAAAAVLAATTAAAEGPAKATVNTHAAAAPRIDVAWARPTVQGQAGGGGFLTITGGATADRLLGASASISKAVELHTMEMDGNVMRMRQIDGIDIPAGQRVELKPGGNHVMFVGLTQTLKNGARFPIKLRFQKAGELTVEMKVTPSLEAAANAAATATANAASKAASKASAAAGKP
jgi:periplasmic copper chaperone A